MLNTEVGSRIRVARCQKGLSQAELANELGCSSPHVSNIETGKTSARVCEITNAAKPLGIDPRTLVTGLSVQALELVETLDAKDQRPTAQTGELFRQVKCFLTKPPLQQQKLLAAWKAVLEMAQ